MPSILRLGAVLLGAVGFVTAVPVELEKRGMLLIRHKSKSHLTYNIAVSANIFDQLEFFSQYSAAAYCLGNNNSPNTKVTCPQGNCARVEAANTNTLTEFEK